MRLLVMAVTGSPATRGDGVNLPARVERGHVIG